MLENGSQVLRRFGNSRCSIAQVKGEIIVIKVLNPIFYIYPINKMLIFASVINNII